MVIKTSQLSRLNSNLITKHKSLIQVEYTGVQVDDEAVFASTEDLHCISLDRDTRECLIYKERPDLCRKFGDESHPMLCCPWLTKEGVRRRRVDRA